MEQTRPPVAVPVQCDLKKKEGIINLAQTTIANLNMLKKTSLAQSMQEGVPPDLMTLVMIDTFLTVCASIIEQLGGNNLIQVPELDVAKTLGRNRP